MSNVGLQTKELHIPFQINTTRLIKELEKETSEDEQICIFVPHTVKSPELKQRIRAVNDPSEAIVHS